MQILKINGASQNIKDGLRLFVARKSQEK